jgi:8-oxo-dGTP pyrophosphatase MutT (NUDIX family)
LRTALTVTPIGETVAVERLRELLLEPEQAIAMPVSGKTDAAVLIPLYADPQRGLVAVLTERRHDLRKHAGEISFPGGRRDPGEDLVTTALREAEEEIGLDRDGVRVMGALSPVGTMVTRYRVYPFVGVIEPGQVWAPHEWEVAQVLELPLLELRRGRHWRPLLQHGLPVPTVSFVVDGHLVWGATARMVEQLLRRLEPVLAPTEDKE